ncbi:MAG: peptide deformylase [Tissierellia bacterium]|nr:peptide deformylase [Tissierellia bacterium]
MAIRKIKTDLDPVLRKVSRPVDEINDRIKILLEDMTQTMYKAEGVGLAAPQIGVLRRVIVVDIGDGNVYKMINPKIIESDGKELGLEGCLSVPNRSGNVIRPKTIKVEYMDEEGNQNSLDANDFLARAICHEIDHLDGILYIDIAEEIFELVEDTEEQI